MDEKFSWVETHKEITKYLSTKEDSQQELIDLLKSVGIDPFNDQTKRDVYDIELSEIDPFTFFCFIHKYGDKKRLKLLQQIADKLDITVPLGVGGIPNAQAQKVWLFPFNYLRVNNEISRLWSFFKKELKDEITDEDFADVLEIRNVGKTKLTESLFYINPDKYLPINGPTIPYIKEILGIDPTFNSYDEYMDLLSKIREKIEMPFYELSYEAWKWNKETKPHRPILSMIENYKKHIAETLLKDEAYKWELIDKYRSKPNLDAKNLHEEIKSIDYSNLMYHLSKAVINELAEAKPDKIRILFDELFDESVDLTKRVKVFTEQTKILYKELGKTNQHHQDERAISAYLTYKYPDKYTLYKYSFYKYYCELIGVKRANINERYTHYLNLIDELIEKYIAPDSELIEQVKGYIPQYYDGKNHKLLTQDILFQTERMNARVNYWVFQGNPTKFDFEAAMKDDVIESWTVTAHKDKIKEGDKVIIWLTGDSAGCYALAEVTSKPYERQTAERDDKYWIEESKNNVVVDIDITHNLMDNPLMKDDIEADKELANLKVGNQGTNFAATEKEYNAILKIVEQTNSFAEVRNKFDSIYGVALFENFIDNLRKIVSELHLELNDERIVYSVRHNRFNFIIGQRYCFNIHLSHPKGVYGYISSEKLREDSSPFDGPPEAYYTNSDDFDLTSEEWTSLIETMRKELKRTTKSSFLSNNNEEFENYVFETIPVAKSTGGQMNYPLNTIFYGPPGTGKTYNTVLRAAEIVEDRKIASYDEALKIFKEKLHNQIEFITFHQNYSYEDFIQGLRPDIGNEKELTFKKKDGVFKVISDRALENHSNADNNKEAKKNYVIIIDEINRANISRVFGELITLIEPDKRSHGEIPLVAQLPSGDIFMVPSNLYIVGTMNTADKSIALLDIALRRRFEFEAMYPLSKIEGKVIHDVDILEKLNAKIVSTKGYDFQIGHSFFMDSKEDAYDLEKRMNNKVIPLLLEYYMNDEKEVRSILQTAGLTIDEKPWPLRIKE